MIKVANVGSKALVYPAICELTEMASQTEILIYAHCTSTFKIKWTRVSNIPVLKDKIMQIQIKSNNAWLRTELHTQLLMCKIGQVKFKAHSSKCSRFVELIQCFDCNQLEHLANECRNALSCRKCSKNHHFNSRFSKFQVLKLYTSGLPRWKH